MADVDTSSYPKGYKGPDILGTLSGVAGLQGQVNQNNLFKQQFQTNLGLGQIYKQAIDPQSGQLDTSKLNALIGQNPNVTLALPQAIQNSQEAQGRNQKLEADQIDLARKNMQTAESYLSPLLAHPDPSSSEIVGALSEAMTKGHLKQNVAMDLYSSLPRGPDGQIDETKIKPWLQQQQMRMMDMKQRFDAMNAVPQYQDNGQSLIPMRTPQIGEPTQAGPAIQKQLPPNTPIFNPQTNAPGYLGATGGAGGRTGAGVGPSGPIASGPALGASEAASVDAQANAQQGIALQQRADATPTNKGILENLESDLDNFTSGPGRSWVAQAKKFVNANTGFGFDQDSVASQEKFNKQAAMLAQSQFQALGGTGTDKQLGSTELTSPSSELSKMGNRGIIALLKGNEDAIKAKNEAWQQFKNAGNGPQSYGKFSTEFNKSYNPRVFQSQYLTTDERKKMILGMSKEAQKTFLNDYRTALTNGWVKLPGGK